MVIVDRVAALCECPTEAWAERLLYICALGKTVLARRAWRDANAKLKRVNITSFVRHKPALRREKATFCLTAAFVRASPKLAEALKLVATSLGSKWHVLGPGASKAGARNIACGSWQELGVWLLKIRRVFNSGIPCWRSGYAPALGR